MADPRAVHGLRIAGVNPAFRNAGEGFQRTGTAIPCLSVLLVTIPRPGILAFALSPAGILPKTGSTRRTEARWPPVCPLSIEGVVR